MQYQKITKVSESQTKLKTSMLRSSLCDYNDVYIIVSRAIAATALAAREGITIYKSI